MEWSDTRSLTAFSSTVLHYARISITEQQPLSVHYYDVSARQD
jgi:hypothetical protein